MVPYNSEGHISFKFFEDLYMYKCIIQLYSIETRYNSLS